MYEDGYRVSCKTIHGKKKNICQNNRNDINVLSIWIDVKYR